MRVGYGWLGALILALIMAMTVSAQERHGTWVDEVIAVEEPSSSAAILQLQIGGLDVYADSIVDPEIAAQVEEDADLAAVNSFGSYGELSFNPAGPIFEGTGDLNPFAVPRVREAMNWLIDRDHIAQEIYGGMAVPKYTNLNSAFPDYARLVTTVRAIEREYAHNPERAEQVITEEMEALGAEMVGGTWHFEGDPVNIVLLIRNEDERMEVGDYVAGLLEDIGFTTTRDYRTAAEASPVWFSGDPEDGLFHIYTGGWITTIVARDEATNYDFFYTPRGLASPLWQAYTPSEEFDELADRLGRRDFRTMEEREELFARALELSMQDSVRVWTIDQLAIWPHRADIAITADLGGGVSGGWLWHRTLRKVDEVGGSVTVAMPSIMTEPWNPIGGSNWVFDRMIQRATEESPRIPDPFTGLHWPHRMERAEVVIEEGLPVGVTHDWVELSFAPEIQVPEDAWADWDPVEQRFITAGERFPEGTTANLKATIYFPDDLFETVKWHDGSTLSLGDLVLSFILSFDRAKEESAIFDEAEVPAFESFMENFRGLRIVSEDPLVVEWYSDTFYLDAEHNAGFAAESFWPLYSFGMGAWHNLAPAIRAEEERELAFTRAQAERFELEQTSFIAGPSLPILDSHLSESAAAGYIPYEPTLGQYISAEETSQRYANLQQWRDDKGHYWLGVGEMYLEAAFPIEGTVQLRNFDDHPDLAGRYDHFIEAMIAEVDLEGPGRVTIGDAAEYEVFISFRDEPYAVEDIAEVKYLVFDAVGDLVFSGDAEPVADGLYSFRLSEEETAMLEAGANRLEVAVIPLLVSIPTFDSLEFVTTP